MEAAHFVLLGSVKQILRRSSVTFMDSYETFNSQLY